MMRPTLLLWLLLGVLLHNIWGEDLIFHSTVHQCIPSSLFILWEPAIYITPSICICHLLCRKEACLFHVYSGEKKECKIYGAGMSTSTVNDTFVDTKVAAPPAGDPLEEIARGKTAFSLPNALGTQDPVDTNMTSFFEVLAPYAWWIVDLETYHFVHKVELLPRNDYFGYRFSDAEIRIGPLFRDDGILTSWDLFGFYEGPFFWGGGIQTFTNTEGICGRYLSVQRANSTSEAFSVSYVGVYRRRP